MEQVDFQIGNIYNAGVFDGKSVVSALAMSLLAAAARVAEASVPPTVVVALDTLAVVSVAAEVAAVWAVVAAAEKWW